MRVRGNEEMDWAHAIVIHALAHPGQDVALDPLKVQTSEAHLSRCADAIHVASLRLQRPVVLQTVGRA